MRGRRRFRRAPIPPPEDTRARINERIRVPKVLLIDQEGEKIGEIATDEARRRAEEADLDLVEVAPNARPPVCRIMDYGKYLFELQKKERVQKRKSTTQEMKEVRLRPGTGQGDLDIKAKHAREFLEDGYKVGIQLLFRGRERAHPEVAIDMIKKFAAMIEDVAKIEQMPRQEGRRMNALLAPTKKALDIAAKNRNKADARKHAADEAKHAHDDEDALDDEDEDDYDDDYDDDLDDAHDEGEDAHGETESVEADGEDEAKSES